MKKLVIRLGAFLGCIGKRFGDAGLQDVLIESEVVATGSMNGVISGKHYSRAVRSNKLMSDALHRMRLQAFLHSLMEEAANKVKQVMADLQQSFPSPQYFEILNSDKFEEFVASVGRCPISEQLNAYEKFLSLLRFNYNNKHYMNKYEDIITNELQTYTYKFSVQSTMIDMIT